MPAVAAGTLGRADMGRVLASTLTRLVTIRVTMCDLLSTPVGPHSPNGAEDSCSSCPSGPKKAAARGTHLSQARAARQRHYYAER